MPWLFAAASAIPSTLTGTGSSVKEPGPRQGSWLVWSCSPGFCRFHCWCLLYYCFPSSLKSCILLESCLQCYALINLSIFDSKTVLSTTSAYLTIKAFSFSCSWFRLRAIITCSANRPCPNSVPHWYSCILQAHSRQISLAQRPSSWFGSFGCWDHCGMNWAGSLLAAYCPYFNWNETVLPGTKLRPSSCSSSPNASHDFQAPFSPWPVLPCLSRCPCPCILRVFEGESSNPHSHSGA